MLRFAFADERKGHMRKRREIAGSSHGAPGGDHRQYVVVKQHEQRIDHFRAYTGVADGEAVGLEQQDAATTVAGSGSPTPQAWLRTRLYCNWVSWSWEICWRARAPKPVLMP